MMIGLLVAGILAILVGVLAIAYGFLLELSFGNTLILAGAFGVCSGMIVLAQTLVVHELRSLGRKLLGPRTVGEARARPVTGAGVGDEGFAPPRDLGATMEAQPAPIPSAFGPSWREEAVSRDRTRQEPAVASPEVVEPAAQQPRRRNLMFSSSMRKDRERSPPPTGEVAPAGQPPAFPEAGDAPPASFEDAWPRRQSDLAPQRRGARAPSAFAEGKPGATMPDRPAPGPRAEQPPPAPEATVIKSGVVDGMAYSLYSDGSIEAQMPEGMMRFASIDELRAHLDQRA